LKRIFKRKSEQAPLVSTDSSLTKAIHEVLPELLAMLKSLATATGFQLILTDAKDNILLETNRYPCPNQSSDSVYGHCANRSLPQKRDLTVESGAKECFTVYEFDCALGYNEWMLPIKIGQIHVLSLYTGHFRAAEDNRPMKHPDKINAPIYKTEKLQEYIRFFYQLSCIIANLLKSNSKLNSEIHRRETVQRQISDRENYLQNLINNSYDAIIMVDNNGIILSCNPRTLETLKLQHSSQLIGTHYKNWIPPHNYHNIRQQVLSSLPLEGERHYFEFNLSGKCKDCFIGAYVSVITQREKQEIQFLVNARDITQQKTNENLWEQTQLYLERLFLSLPVPVFHRDAQGVFLNCNKAYAQFEERTRKEIIGKHMKDIFSTENLLFYANSDKILLENRIPQSYERTVRLPLQNELTHYEIFKTTFENPITQQTEILGVVLDVTKKYEITKALTQSEKNLKSIFETIPNPIFQKDENGIYINCNKAYCDFIGKPKDEIIGAKVEDIQPQEIAKKLNEEDKQLINGNKMRLSYEVEATLPNGELHPIIVHKSAFHSAHSTKNGVVGILTDLKKLRETEKALLESQEKFQLFFQQSKDGICLMNEEQRILEWNQAFENISGLSRADVLGEELSKILHTLTRKEHHKAISKALAINKKQNKKTHPSTHTFELTLTPEKKQSVFALLTVFPLQYQNKTMIGMVLNDITERKRIEVKLRHSEALFRDIIENTEDMISMTDLTGQFIYLSPSHERILGYTLKELHQLNVTELLHPADINNYKEHFNNEIEKPAEQLQEIYRFRQKDGKYLWIESKGKILTNEAGEPERIIFSRRDISESVKSRDNLRFLFRAAINLLKAEQPDAIYKFIGEQVYQYNPGYYVVVTQFNQQTQSLFTKYLFGFSGFMQSLLQLLGTPPEKFQLNKDDIDRLQLFKRKFSTLKTEEIASSFSSIAPGLLTRISKLMGFKRVYYIGLSFHDQIFGTLALIPKDDTQLTQEKSLETFVYNASLALYRLSIEKELQAAKLQAEESDKLKSAFLANMSHEIRTPMNGILGFTQLLLRSKYDQQKQHNYLQLIYNNSKHLLHLINDIIDISKIEAGKLDIQHYSVNLPKLIDDVYHFFASDLAHKDQQAIDFQKSIDIEHPYGKIITDGNRLTQILTNLLGNAFKFTTSGFIYLACKRKKDRLYFAVQDTGSGISPESQKAIFDRFKQADDSPTRPHGGTGLGLAISKQLVELMGGTLNLESTPGKGSTFSFSIPFVPVAPKLKPQKNKLTKEQKKYKDKIVLIVEDDQSSYEVIANVLQQKKLNSQWVKDGKTAIKLLSQKPEIDLLLLDIQLPGASGYQVADAARKYCPNIPIIAQTANAMTSDREKIMEAGCNHYLTKPLELDKLSTAIDELLA